MDKELKIAVAGTGYVGLSIATLLSQQHQVTAVDVIPDQKFDPYINIDPGTLNPYEHGECYVTVDGKKILLKISFLS